MIPISIVVIIITIIAAARIKERIDLDRQRFARHIQDNYPSEEYMSMGKAWTIIRDYNHPKEVQSFIIHDDQR